MRGPGTSGLTCTIRILYLVAVVNVPVNANAAAQRLSAGIKFPTISNPDRKDFDEQVFKNWHAFVEKTYPLTHKALKRELIGNPRGYTALEPAVAGQFVWGTTSFAFYSRMDFQPSTAYRVEISTGLRALDGTALEAPYVFTFATDSFMVHYTQPYPGALEVPFVTTIETRFSMELDPAAIAPAFAIAPAVSGTFDMPDRGVVDFTPGAPLAPSTLYEVTIVTPLRAANGAAFPAPYTFSFTTRTP
jgi:Bacterial Ig-like domain